MNYGQIIFHLEDYYNYGGVISTTAKGIQIITDPQPPEEVEDDKFVIEDGSINIYENLINNQKWDKVGIQAPPGTQFLLNGQKFIIGPSGIYELSDVNITELYFKPLQEYTIDEVTTQTYLTNGKQIMKTALVDYSQEIKNFVLDTQENIEYYKNKTEEYIALYETGYNQYQVGINGIYNLKGYQVQKNIIIDYREVSDI